MEPHTDDPECRQKSELKLAGFLPRSSVNGPGIRAVVWVQGCPLRCQGCFNPGFLPFSNDFHVPVRNLAETILATNGIDGVTFSGGEPFAQAAPLAELGAIMQRAGMSVVSFTGYTLDQIMTKNRPSWHRLLSVTDILIAGPYRAENAAISGRPAGSTGKQVIRLIEGIPARSQVCDSITSDRTGDEIEFSILPDGRMVVTGFPGNRLIREMGSLSSGV